MTGASCSAIRRRSPRSSIACCTRPRAQVRAPELAHEDPHRLAHRGRDEVELTCLGQPAEIAGFALSINCRFSAVHRGARHREWRRSPAIPLALAVPGLRLLMVESKTRKSVFLGEAVRMLGLPGAEVANARFEELLAHPDLHEAHDLATIRAVRLESRVLMTLQAFARPGGLLFLFRGSGAADPSDTTTPPLVWKATYPLIESPEKPADCSGKAPDLTRCSTWNTVASLCVRL